MQKSNLIGSVNSLLASLASDQSLETAIELASSILSIVAPSVPSKQVEEVKEDVFDLNVFGSSKNESWFKEHPYLGGHRVALVIHDDSRSKIQGRFFQLKNRLNKQVVAGAVQIVPNWEDDVLFRYDDYKIGIDFFLTPDSRALVVAVSKESNLRVIELRGKLSSTQIRILEQIAGTGELPSNESVHHALWEAFAIQEVNKQFYQGVSEHFTELLQHLTSANNKSSHDAKLFSSRLVGRLLFVWFLRKKGLISEDLEYFDATAKDASDYYHCVLKELFFHTLNTPREQRTLFADDSTPYLNGGLFEAHDNDWYSERIEFPEGFFVRLYAHFDQFNFTTDESSPEYEQVAIDPEMLGRVFESLLATQLTETGEHARKAKGTFYTPREIVSYICKESLREYLYNALEDPTTSEGVDRLLDSSDAEVALQHTNFRRNLWGDQRSRTIIPKVISHLDQLKVLDPACGSGAFPMGMVQLLVRTYERLESRFDPYRTKLKIIQDNIFGVDIEPMAVEIARLRTWLSLVVDEKSAGGVEPLPNLDFKFVCANTLLKLNSANDIFNDQMLDEKLSLIRQQYFNARKHHRKVELQEKYSKLTSRRENDLLENERTAQLTSFDPFKNSQAAEYFDSESMFGVDKFDLVIGNPPYIQIQKMDSAQKVQYGSQGYRTFAGSGDIYCLFYERSVDLLKPGGILSFITSNKWMKAAYGKNLRYFLATETNPKTLIDLGGGVFESATVDTNIIVLTRGPYKHGTQSIVVGENFDLSKMSDYIRQNSVSTRFSVQDSWIILNQTEVEINQKITQFGVPLNEWGISINYGVKTGLNEAFIIGEPEKQQLIARDPSSAELIRPILNGKDLRRYGHDFPKNYLIATYPSRQYDITEYPAIHDYLIGFGRLRLEQSGQMRVDDLGNNARKKTPHRWFELQDTVAYYESFESSKIAWGNLGQSAAFSFVGPGVVVNAPSVLISPFSFYLLGMLNSKIADYFMRKQGVTRSGGYLEYKPMFVKHLPVPLPKSNPILTAKVGALAAQRVQETDESKGSQIEADIDDIAFELYGLTESERKFILDQ